METQQFEELLRHFNGRKPFVPFVVELLDGRAITVDQPVVFGGGAASFLTDDALIEFECENVRAIRQAAHETSP